MKVHCVSFVDSRYEKVARRLRAQAARFSNIDHCITFSEKDLEQDFVGTFEDVLKPSVRGFGFYAWKPQVIAQAMRKAVDGDIVLYVDGGSHLNYRGARRLDSYIQLVSESQLGVLAFQTQWSEKDWSKGDVIDFFQVRSSPQILLSGQIAATFIVFKVSEASKSFVESWIETFSENFALIDDSPSVSPNLEGFRQHRHDQSIFSLMAKTRGAVLLDEVEQQHSRFSRAGRKMPVHNRRDLPGHSSKRLKVRIRRMRERLDERIVIWRDR